MTATTTTVVKSLIGMNELVWKKKACLYTIAFGANDTGVAIVTGMNSVDAAVSGGNTVATSYLDIPVVAMNTATYNGANGSVPGTIFVARAGNATAAATVVTVLVFGH